MLDKTIVCEALYIPKERYIFHSNGSFLTALHLPGAVSRNRTGILRLATCVLTIRR